MLCADSLSPLLTARSPQGSFPSIRPHGSLPPILGDSLPRVSPWVVPVWTDGVLSVPLSPSQPGLRTGES